MPGRRALELSRDEIVRAALEIFESDGLPAVSMRTVAARLGVSPVPVYRRVGNKDALLDAMAYALLADVVPPLRVGVDWRDYAVEWATALRDRLGGASDTSLLIGGRRAAYVEASKPLVAALQSGGFDEDAAVQACRLLIWAVAGFVAVETRRPDAPPRKGSRSRPGGDPHGISAGEADELFQLHLRLLVGGLEPEPVRPRPPRDRQARAKNRPPARRG
jgi:TetR/AcrR family transcriptional regulator, tetracycline repressor protein